MTATESTFLDLKKYEGGTFSGVGKGQTTGIRFVGISSLIYIQNISYVEGLKYNLLCISQLCNNGYIVSFNKNMCIVLLSNGHTVFIAKQKNNLYNINL